VAALVLGLAAAIAGSDVVIVVGLITLAPVFAHVRHVGWRAAVTEPSAMTFVVAFYVLFFPVRGLVLYDAKLTDLQYATLPVTMRALGSLLIWASICVTALVEAYYLIRRWHPTRIPVRLVPAERHQAMEHLAMLLGSVSLLSLAVIIEQHGGLGGARAALVNHAVVQASPGNGSGVAGSAWALCSIPAVWACVYLLCNVGSSASIRWCAAATSVAILAAQLYVYGSRLDVTQAIMGAWIVFYYSGRRLPASYVLLVVPLAVVASQLVVSTRVNVATAKAAAATSPVERYSRLAGYGVLDISLDLHAKPGAVRAAIRQPGRWVDLPLYFVPSALWHDRPAFSQHSLALYVARTVGTVNDQNTGFPTTYLTEAWLLFGWGGAVVWSLVFGAFGGWISRLLIDRGRPPGPAAQMGYCLAAIGIWNYFKDGDIVGAIVGQGHQILYFVIFLWATNVIGAKRGALAGQQGVSALPAQGAEAREVHEQLPAG
jgi:hypothetical protein